jgi:hypothetical protein
MAPGLLAAPFQAGVARRNITPQVPFWLSGYAARTNPAASIHSQLWAKALALQDAHGERVVIVTTDLIGLPNEITSAASARLEKMARLPRAQILFNSSHTHAGPAVWPNLKVMFDLNPADHTDAVAYAQGLVTALVEVASEALDQLKPAGLSYTRGEATFAINRRQPTPEGTRLGEHPTGPVDHDVPILRIDGPAGQLRAVLFGYACHNTTLVADNYEIDGDYAGAAQRAIEREHPNATALFLMLCGGDQNPSPRGTMELAQQHGETLARAVVTALKQPPTAIEPSLLASYVEVPLEFVPHTRDTFEAEAQSNHVFRQRRARLMLDAYDRGKPVREIVYPVQAIRLGQDLALLGLGGEVVVDFGLELKREFGRDRLIVAGYCNDVMCYIPNVRILREGGYEPVDSMIYYGQPGPFTDSVESTVLNAARTALKRVGFERASQLP